jgi:hypothetical protein
VNRKRGAILVASARALTLPALYLVTAVLLTWPLVTRFSAAVPLGSEPNATVPQFNVWTLQWNLEKIRQGFDGYWDAPIFYPAEGAFAFSDPQPAAGLLAFPLSRWSPPAAYNAVLLLYVALNGVSAYYLLHKLAISKPVALLGGFWVQSLPFLTHERGVLQLQPFFVVVFVMIAALELARSPSLRRATVLGLALGGGFFFSEYYGLIAGLAAVVFFAFSALRTRQVIFLSLLAFLLAAVIALPLLLQQRQILQSYSFSRSLSSVEAGSANLQDYLRPSQRTLLSEVIRAQRARFGLYPGLALFALALFSLSRFSLTPANRSSKPAFILSAVFAFLLSLGLNLNVLGFQPYHWLWKTVPGFAHIRSPFRFGLLLQFALLVLALFVVEKIWRERKYILFAALVLIVSLEILPLPERLADLPPGGILEGVPSPAVFLPFASGRSPVAFYQTSSWMLVAQPSGITMVNGYSGYFPAAHSRYRSELQAFPDAGSLSFLAGQGVRAIVVPSSWLADGREAVIAEWLAQGKLAFVGEQLGFSIFALP